MRVVYSVHGFPPYHNAGAETYAHQLCRWLAGRGHEVQVISRGPVTFPEYEGVRCKPRGPIRWLEREFRPGTVVLTHLDETPTTEAAARKVGAPLAHVLHNDKQLGFHGVTYASLIIANSNWIAAAGVPDHLADVPRVVLYPPTFTADYSTSSPSREAVTLVNLTAGKGAPLFYELARRLPDRPFLGVTGGYGEQIPPPKDLTNVTIAPNRADMARVWARTRVLIVPSAYESYGKAAVEALASAIPVIAHPTDGLLESLGDAGIFVDDLDDLDAWVAAIEALDKAAAYRAAAKLGRLRARELERVTRGQLEALEVVLEELAHAHV